MSASVCIAANAIEYPDGGGHLWVYLNWALGLRSLGCKIVWLEGIDLRPDVSEEKARSLVEALRERLKPYGLDQSLALWSWTDEDLPAGVAGDCLDLDAAAECDVLLNFQYTAPPRVLERFARTALIDIDPGLLQIWLREGQIRAARHDMYWTTGETVGRPGSRVPDVGLPWCYTPPCVALDWWPVAPAQPQAAFTTVSHWQGEEWVDAVDGWYLNTKRAGFQPFVELPARTSQRLELALCLSDAEADERAALERLGWKVTDSHAVARTPWEYQRYLQSSKGEFSCVKPSCVRLQNAWISDRTICYLASGRPAVVQHTGNSGFLPDRSGLFRFRDVSEAAACLAEADEHYDQHCRAARQLAEEWFDAKKVAARVLEQSLA